MLQVEGDVQGRDCPDHLVCVQTSTAIFSSGMLLSFSYFLGLFSGLVS